MTDLAPRQAKTSIWHRLYHGETTFDFVRLRRYGFAISGALLLMTVLSLFTRGLNLGLDFEGGVSWEVPAANGLDASTARTILDDNGIVGKDAKIQTLRSPEGGTRLRIQVGAQDDAKQQTIRQAFADKAKVDITEVAVNQVSPTWGNTITKKARNALIVFLIILSIYISIRFEWRMAVAAIAAMIHDVGISVGVYSIIGFEVTPATVIAFLTILGFSLYDTIVVFDKVHENSRRLITNRMSYRDIVNLSMNQVLMRSINTSLAAVLPVLSLLIVGSELLGAVALQEFALALLVGLITGSYSSIFIATPILAMLKSKGDRLSQAATKRAASRAPDAPPRRRAAVLADDVVGDGDELAAARPAASGLSTTVRPTGGLNHPPRPRKKRRR
jgi:preprotein translocase subunit SecF